MASLIIFDIQSLDITQYLPGGSYDPPAYANRKDVAFDTNMETFIARGIPIEYCRFDQNLRDAVMKSQQEIDAIIAAQQAKVQAQQKFFDDLKTKLVIFGFTDDEANFLMGTE